MGCDADELLFEAVKKQADANKLLSRDHFTVDGTLIEACASMKSFKRKDGSGDADDGENFHGQKRSNETHVSRTDPDALPGVSEKRLSLLSNGKVCYELKTPYRDGSTHVIFEPMDFIAGSYVEPPQAGSKGAG